jgi:hypothetical protein
MQQLLDTALERASPSAKARFSSAVADQSPAPAEPGAGSVQDKAADAERRLSEDPDVDAALNWLDVHAEWEPGTSRRHVASWVTRLDARELHDRTSRRERVDRRRIAQALGVYYGEGIGGHGRYSARIDSDYEAVVTSVFTCDEWLDLDCPLIPSHDRLSVATGTADGNMSLDEAAAGHAVRRLAETLTMGTRLVDMPLYRLLAIDIRKSAIAGSLGVTHFARYALTTDLLEGELVDALAADIFSGRGALPLRDRYLPDVASVLDVGGRLCGLFAPGRMLWSGCY